MDLDKFIEYMMVTDQLDDTFGLKEKCPSCGKELQKSNDRAFPYYCPNCELLISKDKTEGKKLTK